MENVKSDFEQKKGRFLTRMIFVGQCRREKKLSRDRSNQLRRIGGSSVWGGGMVCALKRPFYPRVITPETVIGLAILEFVEARLSPIWIEPRFLEMEALKDSSFDDEISLENKNILEVEDERNLSHTRDGSLNRFGKPAAKAKTGRWRSGMLLLVNWF
ncbi:hypothetical protein Scep_006716 [Stephania cephalantha]|uniref:Uncharacterized protein n=1 Tax=Stephania cephalantha TaxID=152367 RepID=A0AAP0KA22_9MAGN